MRFVFPDEIGTSATPQSRADPGGVLGDGCRVAGQDLPGSSYRVGAVVLAAPGPRGLIDSVDLQDIDAGRNQGRVSPAP